jgi:hypothetical protein
MNTGRARRAQRMPVSQLTSVAENRPYSTGQVGPAVTGPVTPDAQGAKAPATGPTVDGS